MGGYRGHRGRPLRWRRVFRSDHLAGLTPSDHGQLAQLGVAAALDFRGVQERAAAAYDVPGLAQHALSIEPTVAQRMDAITARGRELTAEDVQGLMQDLYRRLITHHAPHFARFFGHLLEAEAPLVFHCTAGKDRTGVAAALLLFALGVPRSTVMEDYMLTARVYRPPWAPRTDIAPEVQQALWGVQPAYLEAALEVLDREHGGPEPYLRRQVGLTETQLHALAEHYLLASG